MYEYNAVTEPDALQRHWDYQYWKLGEDWVRGAERKRTIAALDVLEAVMAARFREGEHRRIVGS